MTEEEISAWMVETQALCDAATAVVARRESTSGATTLNITPLLDAAKALPQALALLRAARAENARLREALDKYAAHVLPCEGMPCTCGLREPVLLGAQEGPQ